ncbi:MAG TPA: LuxR C-terminal-related transcriptional regulator [Povalibacter sp.]|uniref:response regulator transcription factor n=1 Tax=Povalibacter sp. TaxID=1962978 RepID=UPI002B6F297A|nr:LuxR C-terminal-related transcriptional regulator [Povalibacter sp.]HMN46558.1 LuxR C-terminal-related transcriptional regulator [Povalibacter sp.]
MSLDSWHVATLVDSRRTNLPADSWLQLREELRRVLAETLDRLLPQLLQGTAMPASLERTADLASLLTLREREILIRIAAGDSNKQIARQFSLSLHTVKRHVANILNKLGVNSRVQAAAWARACH